MEDWMDQDVTDQYGMEQGVDVWMCQDVYQDQMCGWIIGSRRGRCGWKNKTGSRFFFFFEINVNGILASLIGLVMIDRINKH